MPRGRKSFHGLRKPRIRQSWNKFNLYNLSRLEEPRTAQRTFFQQKWTAKSHARAYHGEHIRERQWTRMFSRFIPSVVSMDAAELAKNDGSEQGAGRGSGKDVEQLSEVRPKRKETTPYMNMTFYPQERRLDTAIFRALFASSTRQARQFVVHGFVKVNGKKMQYPGYLLNPGDMFTVDPDMVMLATGKQTTVAARSPPRKMSAESGNESATEAVEQEEAEEVDENEEGEQDEEDTKRKPDNETLEQKEARKKELMRLRDRVDKILTTNTTLRAKQKQELRALYKDLRKGISGFRKVTEDMQTEWETRYDTVSRAIDPKKHAQETSSLSSKDEQGPLTKAFGASDKPKIALSQHLLALKAWPNQRDRSKPYKTPWQPRNYMSAFAFIPRYLEVNQNVCSAVYLRHPVARPGLAEVPSPFGPETNLLAFQWYLRRR